jgi:hypothetical protein
MRRLKEDAGLRRRLGRAARAAVVSEHTWDAVVGRILEHAGVAAGPAREASG